VVETACDPYRLQSTVYRFRLCGVEITLGCTLDWVELLMENYHVIDLVGEGSFGKVSNRGSVCVHITFMSLTGMTDKGYSGHDI